MNTISIYLDKAKRLQTLIKSNGGVIQSLYQLFLTDDIKEGRLVGEDKFGNKYYENNSYFFGRNRWVNYNRKIFLNYNASQIPPEWHGWIHYSTDYPPTIKPGLKYNWMEDYTENMTGTMHKYVPYSTMPTKVHTWDPNKALKK